MKLFAVVDETSDSVSDSNLVNPEMKTQSLCELNDDDDDDDTMNHHGNR